MLFVVLGLFSGVFSKSANASNNYINDISFYKENNKVIFQFHTITSFTFGNTYWFINSNYADRIGTFNGGILGFNNVFYFIGDTPNCYGGWPVYCDFVAGHTYKMDISEFQWDNGQYPNLPQLKNYNLISTDYIDINTWFFPSGDILRAYFQELPTLTITYPQDNDEVVNIFDITGSFTQPSENPSSFLQADIMPTGTYISSLQSFWTAINQATSGNFSITIGNVSAGYYDFRIYFRSGAFDFYQGALISNIHIVNDLPPFIPPWEQQPPSTAPPVFQPIATSTFSTSTGLYTQMTNTFAPVLFSIVSNLQRFSSNFTQSNASSTGNQIGQSILLVRSYLSNINSFFSNFPVSQFLLLYLIALVVVIVLRLTKGLINLFKI